MTSIRGTVRLLAALAGTSVASVAVSLAAPAGAAPLTTLRADADGDGTPDTITVEPDGRVVLARSAAQGASGVASAELKAPDKIGEARVTVEAVEGHQIILARATQPSRAAGDPWKELLWGGVFEWDGGALAPIWTGALGPQGQDGEWIVELEVVNGRLLLYEKRPEVTACDGTTSRLHQRMLDVTNRRFQRAAGRPDVAADATTITPVRAAPAGLSAATRPTVFRFQSATTQFGDGGNAEGLAAPTELEDGDLKTAWAEGLGGFGRGEVLVARGQSARYQVVAVRVIPGDAASTKAFGEANRLKKLVLTVGSTGYRVEWPADPAQSGKYDEPWWIPLPSPVAAGCVSLAIDDVYQAKKNEKGRTAISELTVLTEIEAGGPAALLGMAEQVAIRDAGWEDAEHHLVSAGGAGAQAALAALGKSGRTADERKRLRGLLAQIPDAAAARELVVALRDAPTRDERAPFVRALGRNPDLVVPELSALAGDVAATTGARAAASALLGLASAPAARAALVGLCGTGNRTLRTAVADALGKRDPSELGQAVSEAATRDAGSPSAAACEADRWRIVSRLARRGGPAGARTQAAELAAARLAETTDYELRYRLLQALGALATEPSAATALDTALRGEKEPALRWVAVDAMGARLPADLFTLALADTDPGVRLAALSAGSGTDAAHPPVIERLGKDKWPAVRAAAARFLGRRCGKTGVADALLTAVGGDDSDDVRRASLEALVVACKTPGLGPKLVELARDRNLSGGLRAYATRLIPTGGGSKMVDELISLLADARANSFDDEDNMNVAKEAAWALGTLKDAKATKALFEAALDPTFPPIQAAALAAIGEFCPPGWQKAVAAGLASPEAAVVRAATLAQKKCRK